MKARAKLILFVAMAAAAAMFMGGLSISGLLPTQTVSSQPEPEQVAPAPEEAAPVATSDGLAWVWADPVSGCPVAPQDDDLANVYDRAGPGLPVPLVGNYLSLLAGLVGTVHAYCVVENLPLEEAAGPLLEVVYRDGDGKGKQCRVAADLLSIHNDGKVGMQGSFNSNDFAGTWVQTQAVPATFPTDFMGNAYEVRVTVTRTYASVPCWVNIVRLRGYVVP